MGIVGLLALLAIVLVFGFVAGYVTGLSNPSEDIMKDYWNCLDGCYNAQLAVNNLNRTSFDSCSDICYDRKINGDME